MGNELDLLMLVRRPTPIERPTAGFHTGLDSVIAERVRLLSHLRLEHLRRVQPEEAHLTSPGPPRHSLLLAKQAIDSPTNPLRQTIHIPSATVSSALLLPYARGLPTILLRPLIEV